MKYYFIFILLILSVFVYGKDYCLEYKDIPKSIDCDFNLYMSNLKEGKNYQNTNNINIKTINSDNLGKYTTEITNKIGLEKEIKNECIFQLENKKTFFNIKKLSNVPIYNMAVMKENLFSSQLFLKKEIIKVGDSWNSTIVNPIGGSNLEITNRLLRVADNIATIHFSGKSPFYGNNIKTEKELMNQKTKIGSTFYMSIDKLSGHAEVNCSGFWLFDIENGRLLKSDQFYKINSLMRKDDKAQIKEVTDFIYADVFLSLNYKFEY